jgi:hypothetical protein
MYETIRDWEMRENGVRVLGRLGFENAYAFAMRGDRAAELGVTSLNDLVAVAPQLTVGGDPEFFERPEWIAVRDAYGLRFARNRNFAPTFMYNALQSGEADVISAYTSDGRIAADKLVVLADPEGALPSYDAMLMLSLRIGEDPGVIAALEPLIGAISVGAMREANLPWTARMHRSLPRRPQRQSWRKRWGCRRTRWNGRKATARLTCRPQRRAQRACERGHRAPEGARKSTRLLPLLRLAERANAALYLKHIRPLTADDRTISLAAFGIINPTSPHIAIGGEARQDRQAQQLAAAQLGIRIVDVALSHAFRRRHQKAIDRAA